jgi:hypothetical protein
MDPKDIFNPKFLFIPDKPFKLGPAGDYKPEPKLEKFYDKQVEGIKREIKTIKDQIKNTITNDPNRNNQLTNRLQDLKIKLQRNTYIYYIEYFYGLYKHLEKIESEIEKRFTSPLIKEEKKRGVAGMITSEIFYEKDSALKSYNMYLEKYREYTNKDYKIGDYKKQPSGSRYKRKLTGKGINNPWLNSLRRIEANSHHSRSCPYYTIVNVNNTKDIP